MIIYVDPSQNPTEVERYSDKAIFEEKIVLSGNQNQTEELLPAIDKLISGEKNKISALYLNITPGTYTAVRVAFATINALGLALGIQPIGVSSRTEIVASGRKNFSKALLPVYKNDPVITERKGRL